MRSLAIAGLCALLAAGAESQYALDKNQRIGSSGRNSVVPRPAVQRDIYTIDRTTGTFRYDRANAFDDPTYSIHQRYTRDRVSNFSSRGVSTGAGLTRSSAAATRRLLPGSGGSASGASRGVSTIGRATRAPGHSASGYSASPSRGTSAGSLGSTYAGGYSVSTGTARPATATLAAPTYNVAR